MKKYLRNRRDGFIYEWHPILARNALCEEVSEMEAYPERFVPPPAPEPPPEVASTTAPKVRQRRALDLSTASIPEPPVYTPPELAADASRRLPK